MANVKGWKNSKLKNNSRVASLRVNGKRYTIKCEAEKKWDAKVKASIILVDNDAPLERQAELLAQHVEKLKRDEHCKKVHILGHSKCGTMNVAMLKYLSEDDLEKLNVISYSAPYLGTIFASPKAFEERLEEVVKEGKEQLLKRVIKGIKEVEPQTDCTKKTLDHAVKEYNVDAGIMYLLATSIFKKGEKNDGTVGLESALHIERICEENGISIGTMRIDSGHHGLFSDQSILKQIFDRLIVEHKPIEQQVKEKELEL